LATLGRRLVVGEALAEGVVDGLVEASGELDALDAIVEGGDEPA
jgi:hypothetical protein